MHLDKIISFTVEKKTKNTVRFAEGRIEGKPSLCKTLYLPHDVAGNHHLITLHICDEPQEGHREMTVSKETTNSVQFSETVVNGQPPQVPTLYLPKWLVGDGISRIYVKLTTPGSSKAVNLNESNELLAA